MNNLETIEEDEIGHNDKNKKDDFTVEDDREDKPKGGKRFK